VSHFRITVDSNLADLFLVSAVIQGVCRHLGMDAENAASLDLCVIEAATNAIKHAYRGAAGHEVSVEICFSRDRVEVAVCDQGASMPGKQVERLRDGSPVFEFDPANLAAVPEGGMGLEIIRQGMDQASYSTEGGTNCLRLTKFLRSRSVEAPA
jgi:serine/threonine-protein kinase RsbW